MSNLYFDAGPPPFCGRKVMLATPSYDSPDASYTYSIARSREVLHKEGIPTAYLLLQGNCHIDDSRNTVVRDFLASDCSELVFLDADVSWEPGSLLALCQYDCDIVGGVYPYRREGREGMPYRSLRDHYLPDEDGLIEVEGLPTGFMRIRRRVLEAMVKDVPHFRKDKGALIPELFKREIRDDQGRWGADIRFCMQWREKGGQVFAAAELTLGHCGKHIIRDSLGASLRRQAGLTLRHVAEEIKAGRETLVSYGEAIRAVDNHWSLPADVLSLAVMLARKAKGPILEIGSGLSTIVMAAATDQTVWAVEHSPLHATMLKGMAAEAGVKNIALVTCPVKDGWYDLSDDWETLPKRFSVALVDGPPRQFGDRMQFFQVFGEAVDVVLIDDADDPAYARRLGEWAAKMNRTMQRDENRAAVILPRAA